MPELDPKEKLVREKIRAGLTREQALAVIAAQEEHDAALAAEAKKQPAKK
ncbi:hypothetical protein [Opitutus terrae]|uniref:Uncharacterized protein n=1 Tax=Opitutus terrae (strain DSM 11246 / JCM 15787 / PB90-1) TaxID=452637 RepID=B1ZV29_OPITP|nr:hypothetical protein [Opitutus terrae]ACB76696.1 hypothetical protein Oter_3419 [Opitutus terrae PB90-1]